MTNSPYSMKVKSYFQYKGIPHEWIVRDSAAMEEYSRYAKLQIVPLVVSASGEAMQDSTPIIEALEAKFPEPSVHPHGPVLRFLSELLEEFGDEWGNKWMFHLRWAREIDQDAVSLRLAKEMFGAMPENEVKNVAATLKKRMKGRGFAVGSNERTAPIIESNFQEFLASLEKHLKVRSFLFGGRPSFADLGLGPQIWEAMIDPTGGDMMRPFPLSRTWCTRCVNLSPADVAGSFESWEQLAPTMGPLLGHAGLFLRWSAANAHALAEGAKDMEVDLGGSRWWQTVGGPQRYHARSLKELQRKFQAVASEAALLEILGRAGCLEPLKRSVPAKL